MNKLNELSEILQDVTKTYQSKLEIKLRIQLNEREKRILDWLIVQYQDENKRRWYDPYHILFSTNFALNLIEEEKLDRLIVTGIMLHDIGYFAIKDKTQWSSRENRITHMQEGTALAAKVLSENGFSASELEKVLGMIAVHDNPYIGIEITGKDRLGLRDCDRVWVMHLLSFYKDLFSKAERRQRPGEFLHDRIIQFYGWEHPFGPEWAVSIDGIKRNVHRIEIPSNSLTQEYVKRQIESRIHEINKVNVLNTSESFGQYLLVQIEKE